ncbi:SDR family NAD(P)-dependent oxidoreductase [Saccharopolyspora sp. 5N708]|uniref:SDR family NAD(P)-dependent oxidoreductase n=1 Tax=Saccharopolyspora sp. 5N708 TaxID=3457424 RepID=UPI003FD307F3
MNEAAVQPKEQIPGLLADKVALITGAGRGIGAAAARVFAAEGAVVMLTSRTEADLVTVVEEIRAADGTADYVVADVGDEADVRRVVDTAVDRYGRLDVAFNNAGIAIPPAPLVEVPTEQFDLIGAINYRSVWLAMRAEIAAMRATANGGAIVNNSSVGGFRANPSAGLGPYGAAKRAVNSITATAAVECGAEGIRVNAIAPGTTLTPMVRDWVARQPDIVDRLNAMTPLRRAADPDEIAEAAAWLLSDRASYVTGVVLPVDGGMQA